MSALEEKLKRYCEPSSQNEQDMQDRAERMVRRAVGSWASYWGETNLKYVPKGSYANNTNVRQDSDVDIAVVRTAFWYIDDSALMPADKVMRSHRDYPFEGIEFRNDLAVFLKSEWGDGCDTTGTTAIELVENTGRVKADIVPSFKFCKYDYDADGRVVQHCGQKVFRTDGTSVVNYPDQQLENGRAKNVATGGRYKKLVRILKRAENELVKSGHLEALPSYFMECLMYRVPNDYFGHTGDSGLTDDLTAAIAYIWSATNPGAPAQGWKEPNEIKPLFGLGQKWAMDDAHNLMLHVFGLFDLGEEAA
ncbi:hypothetical protein [Nocardia vaccinii]|uniref:hypothetical protein n=1 Tax=Nocardia vaccinii TaxID=1822 RepID=UPI0008300899|nr:hypothetical protein [Nocardia vaccinii]